MPTTADATMKLSVITVIALAAWRIDSRDNNAMALHGVVDAFVSNRKNNAVRYNYLPPSLMHQPQQQPQQQRTPTLHYLSLVDNIFSSQTKNIKDVHNSNGSVNKKLALLNLLSKVPPNESTSKQLTKEILQAVNILEEECPTFETDVLSRIAGNWELVWTAQDKSSLQSTNINSNSKLNPFATFINPLENQSYSNNPIQFNNEVKEGRSNPILPQGIQNTLEDIGLLRSATSNQSRSSDDDSNNSNNNTIKSTQAIDLKKNRIRNVVAFTINNALPLPFFNNKDDNNNNKAIRGFITVDVKGKPNPNDERKIDVKFDTCRISILDTTPKIDITFPLGIFGPTGWLRTTYVDDTIRITRGHKGSVFILSRTASLRI